MRGSVGYLFYIVAIACAGRCGEILRRLVPPVTAWVMKDSTESLLAALVFALISRWL
jgi:hypothetical protein